MKTRLIIFALFISSAYVAYAAQKKPELREASKALKNKNSDSTTNETLTGRNPSQDYQAAHDKTQQLESKRTHQYQEERPKK